jgi:hypothetical protein
METCRKVQQNEAKCGPDLAKTSCLKVSSCTVVHEENKQLKMLQNIFAPSELEQQRSRVWKEPVDFFSHFSEPPFSASHYHSDATRMKFVTEYPREN